MRRGRGAPGTLIRLRALVAGAILLPGIAGCAAASVGAGARTRDMAYAWARGDTLRYRITSETFSSVMMVDERKLLERRGVRFALVSTGEGRATAWIENARLEKPGAETPVRTAGPEIVGLPLVMAVGQRGIDSVVTQEGLSQAWPDVANDIRLLLLRVPGGPLPDARTWGDGGTTELSKDTLYTEPETRRIDYRVVGQSRIGRTVVTVVDYEGTRTSELRRRGPPPPPPPGMEFFFFPSVIVSVRVNEQGRVFFDARSGRLVRHTRTVSREISQPPYTSAEAHVVVYEYRQTLELISATAPARR